MTAPEIGASRLLSNRKSDRGVGSGEAGHCRLLCADSPSWAAEGRGPLSSAEMGTSALEWSPCGPATDSKLPPLPLRLAVELSKTGFHERSVGGG